MARRHDDARRAHRAALPVLRALLRHAGAPAAREKAELILVNHHLFFADRALRAALSRRARAARARRGDLRRGAPARGRRDRPLRRAGLDAQARRARARRAPRARAHAAVDGPRRRRRHPRRRARGHRAVRAAARRARSDDGDRGAAAARGCSISPSDSRVVQARHRARGARAHRRGRERAAARRRRAQRGRAARAQPRRPRPAGARAARRSRDDRRAAPASSHVFWGEARPTGTLLTPRRSTSRDLVRRHIAARRGRRRLHLGDARPRPATSRSCARASASRRPDELLALAVRLRAPGAALRAARSARPGRRRRSPPRPPRARSSCSRSRRAARSCCSRRTARCATPRPGSTGCRIRGSSRAMRRARRSSTSSARRGRGAARHRLVLGRRRRPGRCALAGRHRQAAVLAAQRSAGRRAHAGVRRGRAAIRSQTIQLPAPRSRSSRVRPADPPPRRPRHRRDPRLRVVTKDLRPGIPRHAPAGLPRTIAIEQVIAGGQLRSSYT